MWEEDLKWSQHLVSKKNQLETTAPEEESSSIDSEEIDVKTDDGKIRAR